MAEGNSVIHQLENKELMRKRQERDKLDLQTVKPSDPKYKKLQETIKTRQAKIDKPVKQTGGAMKYGFKQRIQAAAVKTLAFEEQEHKESLIAQIVHMGFQVNPSPDDEQVHALAHFLNVDPPTLESIIYAKFGANQKAEAGVEDVLSMTDQDPVTEDGAEINDGTFVENNDPVEFDGLVDPLTNTDVVDTTHDTM